MKCDHCKQPIQVGEPYKTIPTSGDSLLIHHRCYGQWKSKLHGLNYDMTTNKCFLCGNTIHPKNKSALAFTMNTPDAIFQAGKVHYKCFMNVQRITPKRKRKK